MRRILLIAAALFALIGPARAADSSVPSMTAASSVAGTDLWYCAQSAGTLDRKCTSAQVAAYVYGLMSGDGTASGTGALTLATVNSNVGTFGSATQCITTTQNAKGLTTAISAATCTPAIGSITGLGTGVATLLGGASSGTGGPAGTTSPTFGTGVTLGFITGSTQCLHVNTSGVISGTGSDCGSGSGAVSSVTAGIGVTVSPTTGAVIVSAPATRRDNTAATDTITSSDKGTIVTESNASAVAVAITTTGFVSTDFFTIKNKGAGLATYTPSSGTINGSATIACAQNQSADLYFDGTNYQAIANTCQLGALATLTPGTGVASQLANAVSTAGGSTQTIAAGTAALGTSAIASGACATVVTVTATNVATTDVLIASYNSDPTAVTGYGASATGAVLTIYPYPTSGNANFKVCNSTSGSITPGSMTLNWRVTR